jgi:hypothetical protein
MANENLTLKTVRARTRGRDPQKFTYQGIGKLSERKVIGKSGNPIVLDANGNQIDYAFDKDGKLETADTNLKADEKGNLVLPEGYTYDVVDDIDASGLTDDVQEAIDFIGTLSDEQRGGKSALQFMIDGALNYANIMARKAASPVTEVSTEDELTPIIAELVKAGFLDEDSVPTWRRTVTAASKQMEIPRAEYVTMTKEYKKLQKSRAA